MQGQLSQLTQQRAFSSGSRLKQPAAELVGGSSLPSAAVVAEARSAQDAPGVSRLAQAACGGSPLGRRHYAHAGYGSWRGGESRDGCGSGS